MRHQSRRLAKRQALYLLAWSGTVQQDLRRQDPVKPDAPLGKPGSRPAAIGGRHRRAHQTALSAIYRRLSARVGNAKAITATVRKIAVLFYTTLSHGFDYRDPDASYSEERYRQRVLTNLQRRASRSASSLTRQRACAGNGIRRAILRRF
jgi:hypothetical protein